MTNFSFRCKARDLVATLLLVTACEENERDLCTALEENAPTCRENTDTFDYECSGRKQQHFEDVEIVCNGRDAEDFDD